MGNSFYVQLSSYILLEYTYGGTDTTYISNQVKLARLKNNYFDGEIQFMNTSPAHNTTQNVLNNSAAKISGNKWAFLNTDVPVPYIGVDSNLIYTDLSQLITSNYVLYDRIRVHILSGYRLDELDGLIIQVYGKEAQTSSISILTNNVYLNSDSRDILNPRPVILGDRMYDRYIEVLVPSIKSINSDFYANPTNPISIGYQYTSTNRGFLFNTGVYVKVFEIASSEIKNGNLFFNTSDSYEVVVNQEDSFSSLSAAIEEATDGDYFKYYPTYAGNFIEDFIAELNASGGDYVVINDIDVYEQVGMDHLMTFSYSQLQLNGFDKPIEWRPIIKYAESAVSFSIDYTVRIYNRSNGYQMIRKASTTSFNPKKYGRNLEKISLANMSYPMKVYNKIVDGPSVTYSVPSQTTNFNTVYVPIFYDAKQVVTQIKSIVTPNDNSTDTGVYFGQGDARIYLSDFETYIKFSIHNVNITTHALTHIDLTKGTISIVFKDKLGKAVTVIADPSVPYNSRALGEIVFKLPANLKNTVLYDGTVKNFNIIIESEGTSPTVIYSGSVDDIINVANEPTRVNTVKSNATTLTALLSTSATTTSTATNTTTSSTSNMNTTTSLLNDLINANSQSLSSADRQVVNQPHIPGYSNDYGAASIKTGIIPTAVYAKKATGLTGTSINTTK